SSARWRMTSFMCGCTFGGARLPTSRVCSVEPVARSDRRAAPTLHHRLARTLAPPESQSVPPLPSSPLRLREFELMDDLLRDLADGADIRVNQHVGLPVKLFARGQEVADFFLRIGVVEQGTMRLVFYALPDFFRRSPEADDQRVLFEAGKILRPGRQAAAGGNESAFARGKFPGDLLFERAEGRFAVPGKNIGDGAAGPRLNQFIRVEVIEAQLVRHQPADGRFAGAHESDEREIDDAAVAVHGHEFTQIGAAAHAIIGRASVLASRLKWLRRRLIGSLAPPGQPPLDMSANGT